MVENPSSLHVLIAEDEKTMLELYKEFLRYTPHQVEYCENGQKALVYYRSGPVDVVITDMRMPGLDGFELVKQIREVDAIVPIAVATCALKGILPAVEEEILQLVDLLEEKEKIILDIEGVIERLYDLGRKRQQKIEV